MGAERDLKIKKDTLIAGLNHLINKLETDEYSAGSIDYMYANLIEFSQNVNAAGKEK